MTMTSQVSFSGNAEIDGILYGTKWSDSSLTFSFAPAQTVTATLLNSVQQDAVRKVLGSVAAVTNLSFSQVIETPLTEGTLRFGESEREATAAAYMSVRASRIEVPADLAMWV